MDDRRCGLDSESRPTAYARPYSSNYPLSKRAALNSRPPLNNPTQPTPPHPVSCRDSHDRAIIFHRH